MPWLGFVKPLVLPKPVSVDGPDPIGSAAYAADFNEVKRVGSATSSERTAAQTDTANFFRVNPVLQLRQALLDHLASHPLSLAGTTRMFAALDAATADALIQAWRLKFDIGYWRPFQAIPAADTDGNDATTADRNLEAPDRDASARDEYARDDPALPGLRERSRVRRRRVHRNRTPGPGRRVAVRSRVGERHQADVSEPVGNRE